MSPAKLGWMAGIIDLKGRLIFKNNQTRRTPQVVLAVQTKELAVLHRLGEMTGTSPEMQKNRDVKDFMRRNCTEHCPEKHTAMDGQYPHGQLPPNGRWTITGAGMVAVLHGLAPYIQVDRGYETAIQLVLHGVQLTGQGSPAVHASLDRLRRLGWKIPDTLVEKPATPEELKAILDQAALISAG